MVAGRLVRCGKLGRRCDTALCSWGYRRSRGHEIADGNAWRLCGLALASRRLAISGGRGFTQPDFNDSQRGQGEAETGSLESQDAGAVGHPQVEARFEELTSPNARESARPTCQKEKVGVGIVKNPDL